ncbi:MAG TPA: hypothetical protein VH333_23095, partial [Pseudonocardiaceae bacterium]|nr:hypothetical protein [Pseudonocardiaceae bacterium]
LAGAPAPASMSQPAPMLFAHSPSVVGSAPQPKARFGRLERRRKAMPTSARSEFGGPNDESQPMPNDAIPNDAIPSIRLPEAIPSLPPHAEIPPPSPFPGRPAAPGAPASVRAFAERALARLDAEADQPFERRIQLMAELSAELTARLDEFGRDGLPEPSLLRLRDLATELAAPPADAAELERRWQASTDVLQSFVGGPRRRAFWRR